MNRLPRYNIYTCEYNCQTITVDVDKGTTPFMIKCKRKPTKDRPIGTTFLDENGECKGIARSSLRRQNIFALET